MIHLFIKVIESGLLVSGMSTLWEDTNDFTNQYKCDLAIYIISLLSYLYDIIMNREINSPCHRKNIVDGPNATDKHYLKGGRGIFC